MFKLKTLTTLTLGLLLSLGLCAQMATDEFPVFGKFEEGISRLKGVKITVYHEGVPFDYHYAKEGYFSFKLPLGRDYEILFEKKNYVNKRIDVLLDGVEQHRVRRDQNHEEWIVNLIPRMHNVDYSEIEDNAFGKVFFDFGNRIFRWDADYAKEVEKNLKKIQRREDKQRKDLEHIERVLEKAKDYVEKHEEEVELTVETYEPRVEEISEKVSAEELEEIERGLSDIMGQIEQEVNAFSMDPLDEIFDLFNSVDIVVELREDGRKVIEIRKVARGNQVDEYWRVKHVWGGEFFFKNDKPSDRNVWQLEARGD